MATTVKKVEDTFERPTTVQEWYATPKEQWRYVAVPQEDPLGKKFATIRLGKEAFDAGKTYHLPVAIADYVEDRIKVFNRSCVRILQPDMAQPGIVRTADGASAPMPTIV